MRKSLDVFPSFQLHPPLQPNGFYLKLILLTKQLSYLGYSFLIQLVVDKLPQLAQKNFLVNILIRRRIKGKGCSIGLECCSLLTQFVRMSDGA